MPTKRLIFLFVFLESIKNDLKATYFKACYWFTDEMLCSVTCGTYSLYSLGHFEAQASFITAVRV